jgi:hypothetical protein
MDSFSTCARGLSLDESEALALSGLWPNRAEPALGMSHLDHMDRKRLINYSGKTHQRVVLWFKADLFIQFVNRFPSSEHCCDQGTAYLDTAFTRVFPGCSPLSGGGMGEMASKRDSRDNNRSGDERPVSDMKTSPSRRKSRRFCYRLPCSSRGSICPPHFVAYPMAIPRNSSCSPSRNLRSARTPI